MVQFQFSATQIKTGILCLKKWAYQKIDKIEEKKPEIQHNEPSGSVLGGILHQEIEEWLKHGTKPPTNSPSWQCIPFLPLPHELEDKHIESEFEFVTAHGSCRGFIDVVIPDLSKVTVPQHLKTLPKNAVVVIDHKSCKSHRFVPTEKQLSADPQVILYGMAVRLLLALPEDTDVYFSFNYFTKKEPYAVKAVVVRQTSEDVVKGFLAFDQLLLHMKELFTTQTKAEFVLGNRNSCGSYGGCYMREQCPDSDRNKPISIGLGSIQTWAVSNKKEPEMSSNALELAKKLAAKQAAQAQNQTPAPTPSSEGPSVTPIEVAQKAITEPFQQPEGNTSPFASILSKAEVFAKTLEPMGGRLQSISLENDKVVITLKF